MENLDPFSGPEFKADSLETLESIRRFAHEKRVEGMTALFDVMLHSEREGLNKAGFNVARLHPDEVFEQLAKIADSLHKTADMLLELVDTLPDIRQAAAIRASAALRRERKMALARAGASGLQSRHSKARELKAWAEQQAKTMKGSDLGIARRLAARIPEHLADASSNPERLIYEHLRARRNTAS